MVQKYGICRKTQTRRTRTERPAWRGAAMRFCAAMWRNPRDCRFIAHEYGVHESFTRVRTRRFFSFVTDTINTEI